MAGKNKSGSLPFPGVAEGFDLVRKVWGVTGLPMLPTPSSMAQFATRLPQTLPSMIAPTLDVEELDKRIADLRAVEQWLNLNVSMLRTTVQSLEVQRNTIATLKSFGGAMLSAGAAQQAATPVSAENWPYPAGQPTAPPAVAPATTPAPSAAPTPRTRGARRKQAAGTHPAAALPLNPTVWWNTLQDQFTKIATAAAAEAQAAAKADARSKVAGEPEPVKKPAARKRRARPVKAA
jgi:hypothetical protein